MRPEMAIVIAQVAIPAPARPCLELHLQGRAISRLILHKLLEQRFKGDLDRGVHANFLGDRERQVFDFRRSRDHCFSLGEFSVSGGRFILASARSFTRFNWWVQYRSKVSAHSCSGWMACALVRYSLCRPLRRTCTRPTSRSTRRCLETDGWSSLIRPTMSPTGSSLTTSRPRISLRRGSATALNTSEVVAALAMKRTLHSHMGICQAHMAIC